jgi:hypothetical protein
MIGSRCHSVTFVGSYCTKRMRDKSAFLAQVSAGPVRLAPIPRREQGVSAYRAKSSRTMTHPDIRTTSDPSDPGDEVQRNFRYQHAYGVILLIAGASGQERYVSVYCEHHEDLLCERDDGTFDAYQVKTRGEESGFWRLNHEPLRHSIRRFVKLRSLFGNNVRRLVFVANSGIRVEPIDSSVDERRKQDPASLLAAVHAADSASDTPPPFDAVLSEYAEYCECTEDDVFATFKVMEMAKGPGRDGFEHEVSHRHLPEFEPCRNLSPSALNGIRDELIQRVYYASSRPPTDPSDRWSAHSARQGAIEAKRISVSMVEEIVKNRTTVPFRFLPDGDSEILEATTDTATLHSKLTRGGLSDHFPTMHRLALSAEARMAEMVYESGGQVVENLAGRVETTCMLANNEAQVQVDSGAQFGKLMLQGASRELETDARATGEDRNFLLGIAALLTGMCRVWWSEQFEVR